MTVFYIMHHTFLDYSNRERQGFILVYSIASRSIFDRLEVFRQPMLWVKHSKPIFMLVGNKADKIHKREMSKDEGVALAKSFRFTFLETLAKTCAKCWAFIHQSGSEFAQHQTLKHQTNDDAEPTTRHGGEEATKVQKLFYFLNDSWYNLGQAF